MYVFPDEAVDDGTERPDETAGILQDEGCHGQERALTTVMEAHPRPDELAWCRMKDAMGKKEEPSGEKF